MTGKNQADRLPNQGRPLAPSFTSLLVHVGRLHYRLLHSAVTRLEIPLGAPPLLLWLSKNDGCRHKELAQNCYLEPATVTSALMTMEKEGLVLRKADEADRRSIRIWLTEKGQEALEKIRRIHQEMEEICLAGFSEEEKAQVRSLLDRVSANMAAEAGCRHSGDKCGC
ncbi:MAG: MarR family transcriptional regulator [Peptococcaceae bacterium]|nr:MarR family transcriptional regulator [Peptococcaceae bacterium]